MKKSSRHVPTYKEGLSCIFTVCQRGRSDIPHLMSIYRIRCAVPTSSSPPSATIVFIIADSLYAPHVYAMQAPELSIRR